MKPKTPKQKTNRLVTKVESYLGGGAGAGGISKFYPYETSPLTLMQLQITHI